MWSKSAAVEPTNPYAASPAGQWHGAWGVIHRLGVAAVRRCSWIVEQGTTPERMRMGAGATADAASQRASEGSTWSICLSPKVC